MALHEHISSNAAGDGIDAALPPMPRVRNHQRALHCREVPKALTTVAASNSSMAAKLCLRFLVLTAGRELNNGSGLVFPSPLKPGHPLSWQTLLKLLRTNELDCTVHGFRSSFKTWAIEATATPWAVGEAALAHVVGNSTEAAYVRGDLFEQRRELMAAWADFVAPATTADLRRKSGEIRPRTRRRRLLRWCCSVYHA